MSPRETIARAIAGLSDFEWDNSICTVRADARRAADAVIGALESMRATAAMESVHEEIGCLSTTEVWQALVGAMRESSQD